MAKNKLGPYLLIIGLIIILVFIVGVRYGQKVEKTNKIINYLISLPPTKPAPTSIPLQFSTYSHSGCGIQFLIPLNLVTKDESTTSSLLIDQNTTINFSCKKDDPLATLIEDKKVATAEITLQNKKIMAKTQNNNLIFSLVNPKTYQTIYIVISKSLFPLFSTSLQYLSP